MKGKQSVEKLTDYAEDELLVLILPKCRLLGLQAHSTFSKGVSLYLATLICLEVMGMPVDLKE